MSCRCLWRERESGCGSDTGEGGGLPSISEELRVTGTGGQDGGGTLRGLRSDIYPGEAP